MLDKAKALSSELIRLRRDIHRHPELSFQEVRTARLVAETLQEIGSHIAAGGIAARQVGSPAQGAWLGAVIRDRGAAAPPAATRLAADIEGTSAYRQIEIARRGMDRIPNRFSLQPTQSKTNLRKPF